MANTDAPKGFIAVGTLDGSKIPTYIFPVDSSNDTNMFVHDLVGAEDDGGIEVADANEGDTLLGSVVALYDSNMNPIGSPNSSVSTKYLPASTAGYAKVALATPMTIFRCQCLTGATPAATDVFATSDHTAGTGNTTVATSGHELTATFGTDTQFKVIGKVDEPGNDWGEHVDVLVVASESYWLSGDAAGV